MKYYARLKNKETQEYEVINQVEAQKLGWKIYDLDVVNGKFFKKGIVSEIDIKKEEVRNYRDYLLKTTVDFNQQYLVWVDLSDEDKVLYSDYRHYLLNYPESSEKWYETKPLTIEEYKKQHNKK